MTSFICEITPPGCGTMDASGALTVLTYLVLAPSLTLSFKWVFHSYGFHYPITVVLTLLALEWIMSVVLRTVSSCQTGVNRGCECEETRTLPTAFLTLTPTIARSRAPPEASPPAYDHDLVRTSAGTLDMGLNSSASSSGQGVSSKHRWKLSDYLGEYFSQRLMAIPIGLCLAAEITLSNLSLLTLSVSFHTMVKSSVPVFVLIFSTLFGLEKWNPYLALTILAIVIGISICSFGERGHFSVVGFLFILGSAIASGLRWSCSQFWLQSGNESTVVELLFWTLPAAIVVLPPFAARWELDHLRQQLETTENPDLVPQLILMAVVFSFAAFGLVYVELALVEKLSSLTFAVLAVAKELLVVVLSMLINKDHLTPLNWLGFCITLVAIGIYKLQRKKKRGGAPTPGRRRSSVGLRARRNEMNSRQSFSRFLKGGSEASHGQQTVELSRLVVRGEGGMARANSLDMTEVTVGSRFPDEESRRG